MEPIRNRQELYCRFESIRFWEEMLSSHKADQLKREICEEHLREMKRSARKYMREHSYTYEDMTHLVKNDGDSYIVLMPLPKTITDEETAREWFEYNEYMHIRPSMYDCTGQLFTSWYKIIERNGRFYAYHCVGIDV